MWRVGWWAGIVALVASCAPRVASQPMLGAAVTTTKEWTCFRVHPDHLEEIECHPLQIWHAEEVLRERGLWEQTE